MATNEQNIKIVSYRGVPGITGEGVYGPVHGTKYGEVVNASMHGSKLYPLADEGSYFLATNPTMGTGIAGIAASTSYDATESLLHIRNTSTTKRLYLDFIDLVVTAAGTNGTTFGVTMTADRGTSRYTSGATAITPVNVNLASSETADCTVKFGALVTTAASADVRLLGNMQLRTVIKVIGDRYRFQFGDTGGGGAWQAAGASLDGTTSIAMNIPCPPVILGENDQFLLHDWGASQSVGASYEFRIGFWMR